MFEIDFHSFIPHTEQKLTPLVLGIIPHFGQNYSDKSVNKSLSQFKPTKTNCSKKNSDCFHFNVTLKF